LSGLKPQLLGAFRERGAIITGSRFDRGYKVGSVRGDRIETRWL
jgi:hypothetical protein